VRDGKLKYGWEGCQLGGNNREIFTIKPSQ
jgi:hypothetical protein